jgi:hypothetical protein
MYDVPRDLQYITKGMMCHMIYSTVSTVWYAA